MTTTLHGYFRSTASWRVRIALNLKGMPHARQYWHLRKGEQRSTDYLALNPQGLVPSFVLEDGTGLTQSLAICEYLDEMVPEPPILPREPIARAKARAFAQAIACDIHPVQNLKILNRLRDYGLNDDQVTQWARDVISEGLAACDKLLEGNGNTPFCFGDTPSLADLCLVPQLGNARRFGVAIEWDRLARIEANCIELPAFREAAPELQPDAE